MGGRGACWRGWTITLLLAAGTVMAAACDQSPDQDGLPEAPPTELDLPVDEGVFLARVNPGSAAAGLKHGDVIVQMGEQPVPNTGVLSRFLIANTPGATVPVVFYRGADRMTSDITLGERPSG